LGKRGEDEAQNGTEKTVKVSKSGELTTVFVSFDDSVSSGINDWAGLTGSERCRKDRKDRTDRNGKKKTVLDGNGPFCR